MASSQNVELEAAKFLHKLIQESRDEPAKLATKLYVVCRKFFTFIFSTQLMGWRIFICMISCLCEFQILQHMKSSGKEHSMPYQVISR